MEQVEDRPVIWRLLQPARTPAISTKYQGHGQGNTADRGPHGSVSGADGPSFPSLRPSFRCSGNYQDQCPVIGISPRLSWNIQNTCKYTGVYICALVFSSCNQSWVHQSLIQCEALDWSMKGEDEMCTQVLTSVNFQDKSIDWRHWLTHASPMSFGDKLAKILCTVKGKCLWMGLAFA